MRTHYDRASVDRIALTSAVATLAAALSLTACGGGTSSSSSSTVTTSGSNAPKPAESITTFASRLTQVFPAGSCQALATFQARFEFPLPCVAGHPAEARDYSNLKIAGTATYGTGGQVDFTSKGYPRGATFLVALDHQGDWELMESIVTNGKTAGTASSPARVAAGTRTVRRFMDALRRGNCTELDQTAAIASGLGPAAACNAGFVHFATLTAALAKDPSPKLALMGGSSLFTFYSLKTANGQYRTLVVTYDPVTGHPGVITTYRA